MAESPCRAVRYALSLIGHDACDDDLADTVSDVMLDDCELCEVASAAMNDAMDVPFLTDPKRESAITIVSTEPRRVSPGHS